MKTILKEITWIPSEMEHGWGNGYVVLPVGHPLHGKGYDEINVSVHGGLTFGKLIKDDMIEFFPGLTEDDIGGWIIGFDTCHAWDNINDWPKERVEEELNNLVKQL